MVTTQQTGELRIGVSTATRRRRLYWSLGNLLLVAGLYLLLYVGGLYAQAEYMRLAARGDSDIEAPRVIMGARQSSEVSLAAETPQAGASVEQAPAEMPAFSAPILSDGQISSAPPDPASAAHVSTVERIVIPSVKMDAKVIEVGWEAVEQNGQQVAVWQVAEYAVGQHRGSANPGEGSNVVLAGHVGGYGQVFRDLYYVLPGDQVTIHSGGRQFLYTVEERLIVEEEGVPAEQRAANAALIGPTDEEVVTMVTCWPPNGPEKFTQRVILRAVPFEPSAAPAADIAQQSVR
jgi:LPXTG-site transpeptidase (sortase) family protein